MTMISAVGLFFYNKFEETSNEKVVNMSMLTKHYFSISMKTYCKIMNFTFTLVITNYRNENVGCCSSL